MRLIEYTHKLLMSLRTVNLPFEFAKTHLPPDPNAERKYSMSGITRLTLLWGKKTPLMEVLSFEVLNKYQQM